MRTGKTSVYLQITEDIKTKIGLGLLRADEKLLSCRELALKLGVNPNTVQRAYTELEDAGYIYTVPKKGVYVANAGKRGEIENIAREKIEELKAAGLKREKLLNIIDGIYGDKDD